MFIGFIFTAGTILPSIVHIVRRNDFTIVTYELFIRVVATVIITIFDILAWNLVEVRTDEVFLVLAFCKFICPSSKDFVKVFVAKESINDSRVISATNNCVCPHHSPHCWECQWCRRSVGLVDFDGTSVINGDHLSWFIKEFHGSAHEEEFNFAVVHVCYSVGNRKVEIACWEAEFFRWDSSQFKENRCFSFVVNVVFRAYILDFNSVRPRVDVASVRATLPLQFLTGL